MKAQISRDEPHIIFVDLNSAFATAEQQAHPSLRGKPVGVTNRKVTDYGCVIAVSYEGKALGVKVGMRIDEAKLLAPDLIVLESDPPKYHHMYQKLAGIMKDYSPKVVMKSIDEGIIDLSGTRESVNSRPLLEIGREIKERVKIELGSHVRVNVGIGQNWFLAKQAASWHKPDGLDQLDHTNLIEYYKSIKLTDLSGIAQNYEARLNSMGIFTVMQFLEADPEFLHRRVFRSIDGRKWHRRLHGYAPDPDDVVTKLGNVGRQYVLDKRTSNNDILLPRFHYLCETTGKKLRFNNVDARGVLVWFHFDTGESWVQRKMFKTTFYTDQEIYRRALLLYNQRPKGINVASMGITCYMLTPSARNQLGLFEESRKAEWITSAIDEINERYGNFVICSANSLEGKKVVKQKIPFGGTRYFELLLKRA
jgi:DNA polymerase-4